ncbi:hypothetical protein BKA70DRAFT_1432290 [Coprinopsis sp. MPI-PUGE-AT-0042]|nr:hypothetical protein BKA70DRAFT_1432290 [Coprinopsis sp. MPI-PUGE-AT-0042]
MRFFAVFVSFFALFATSNALLLDLNLGKILGHDWSPANHYNAPTPPWQPGANPGWYFGSHPEKHPKLFCLVGLICKILNLFPHVPHCPKPPKPPGPSDGYTPVFQGLDGATQAGTYLTFGLVDTVADCKAMCNEVAGCVFINTYHDVNGKDGSTQLTCSLFSTCQDASTATNKGGQTQPDGSINYIKDSDGYCKA